MKDLNKKPPSGLLLSAARGKTKLYNNNKQEGD
jgi:hypothetical protein